MRDFTLKIYKKLLDDILEVKYEIVTFKEYIEGKENIGRVFILRHDVDKKPLRSLRTAEMENKLGIKGTYYFRVLNNELPKEVIERIVGLGHEIGYHYNDLNDAGGIVTNALDSFKKNLGLLRESAPVKTVCMHGSPLSRYDNRDLWKNFDYHELGIIGEPYFDIDFSEVLYLTDTGRRWDGDKVSIRDKVIGEGLWVRGKKEDRRQKSEDREQNKKNSRGAVCDPLTLQFHSTMDIIHALNENVLPDKIMLTIHPQRWTDQWLPWIWELCWQNVKNGVKYFVVKDIW